MKHIKVESSNIYSIGHEGSTLEITFKNKAGEPGATYAYTPVSFDGYKAFFNAESKGKFFAQYIKDNPQISFVKLSK